MRSLLSIVSITAVAAGALGGGCGGGSDDAASGKGGSGGHAAGGAGAKSGDGSAATSGGGVGNAGSTGSDAGPTIAPDAACATHVESSTLVPVDMFVMFDRSGSMADNSKWPNASGALNTFFHDPASAGIAVALRLFPDDKPVTGCNFYDCSVDACSQPLVPLGTLLPSYAPTDTQEDALVKAILGVTELGNGGTPLSAALGGAEKWATNYKTAHADDKVMVVFVTDGVANGCDENIANIAALAGDGFKNHDVLTYAIGLVGSAQSDMDSIAQAGGTQSGIFIDNTNLQTQLETTFKAIQGSAISCVFALPQPAAGQTADLNQINVDLTVGSPPSTATLVRTNGIAECGPAGGWYYDNPTNPTSVILCPTSCSAAQTGPATKIDILVGCETLTGSGGTGGTSGTGGSGTGASTGSGGSSAAGGSTGVGATGGSGASGGACPGNGVKCATSADCCNGYYCIPDGLGGLVCSVIVQ